jgi:hypothetical protein
LWRGIIIDVWKILYLHLSSMGHVGKIGCEGPFNQEKLPKNVSALKMVKTRIASHYNSSSGVYSINIECNRFSSGLLFNE